MSNHIPEYYQDIQTGEYRICDSEYYRDIQTDKYHICNTVDKTKKNKKIYN